MGGNSSTSNPRELVDIKMPKENMYNGIDDLKPYLSDDHKKISNENKKNR